jgi:hypothetical protein
MISQSEGKMKIKGILKAILTAVFCFHSTVLAYDFSLVVGQDRSFTEYNVHDSWFQDDPGNLLPWPVNRVADATDNYASVSLLAAPGQAGMAYAQTGVKYDLQLGPYDWNTVRHWPIRVNIRFSYLISAQWTLGTGSGNAWIDLPNAIQYDFIGWETQETGSRGNQVTYTWNTTLEQIQSQMGGEIVLETGCQAHASANFTISNSSSSDITIDFIQIEFLPRPLDLSGEYWFGSLGADVTTHVPWGKRGTVTINGSNWSQEWDDYNGHHTFASAFTTTVQPDGSININFPAETYNVAWNGDVMIHADAVPAGNNRLGIDYIIRKAVNPTANDVIGDHVYFEHRLGWDSRWDEVRWTDCLIDASNVNIDLQSFPWTLDSVNAMVYVPNGSPGLLCKGDMIFIPEPLPIPDEVGYNLLIKKTNQNITPADMAGTYQARFLETGPGGVPYTCGSGTGVIDSNGVLSADAYYSDGEHDVFSAACTFGPGNMIYTTGGGNTNEGIISPDKKLIFIPEYNRPNPPSADDWIGGILLIRVPVIIIADLNGDGVVDLSDLKRIYSDWLQPSPGVTDFDGDGIVNLADFALLARYWLEGV